MSGYLWTPWRMNYIAGAGGASTGSTPESSLANDEAVADEAQPKMESTGCVFCDRIGLPESHDRASLILLRAEHSFVILNLYPYNSAHLMIVPYQHTADFLGLEPGTLAEMTSLAQRMVGVIGDEYHPQGFNLGMNLGRVAGAGVADHLHLHVVPRWAGDTNFMPIVGATKVMPELLETTYDRLRARLTVTKR
jgi:ATP adenylyltransferase